MTQLKTLAVVVVSCLTLWSGAARAEPPAAPSLEVRARSASTAQDHVELSKGYRQRGEALAQQAAEQAAQVERLRRQGPDPMAAKWRHAIKDPLAKARERLAETQRAAFEARELARHHAQLAAELGLKAAAPQK